MVCPAHWPANWSDNDVLGVCSFRGDLAARPRWAGRTLSWALDMANFENVPVQLTGFEMENSTMLWSVFISEVGQNIKVRNHCACLPDITTSTSLSAQKLGSSTSKAESCKAACYH